MDPAVCRLVLQSAEQRDGRIQSIAHMHLLYNLHRYWREAAVGLDEVDRACDREVEICR